jgi:hypothetical protein
VALPAGVAEYPLVRFGVFTFAGSLLWCGGMALIGYGVGSSYHQVMKGFSYAGYLLGAAAVVAIAVVVVHRYRSYKAATTRPASPPPASPPPATSPGSTTSPAGPPATVTSPDPAPIPDATAGSGAAIP